MFLLLLIDSLQVEEEEKSPLLVEVECYPMLAAVGNSFLSPLPAVPELHQLLTVSYVLQQLPE